jgi:hypothetical protein
MKVETFLICESVETQSNGKHIIQGERQEFFTQKVPSVSQPVSIPVYISLSPHEGGKHKVGFTVKHERGDNAIDGYEITGDFQGDCISFVYQDVMRFSLLGNYSAKLTIDGRVVSRWPFVVKPLQ